MTTELDYYVGQISANQVKQGSRTGQDLKELLDRPGQPKVTNQKIWNMISHPFTNVFGAFARGTDQLVGTVTLSVLPLITPDEACLRDLSVAPEFCRQHIDRTLVAAVFLAAKQRRFDAINIDDTGLDDETIRVYCRMAGQNPEAVSLRSLPLGDHIGLSAAVFVGEHDLNRINLGYL